MLLENTGWAKNRTVLRDNSFAMVNGKKAYDMSNVSKFCVEKS